MQSENGRPETTHTEAIRRDPVLHLQIQRRAVLLSIEAARLNRCDPYRAMRMLEKAKELRQIADG